MFTAEARKRNDFYKCNIPCEETVFVPSLSFASIAVDEDTIRSRRQEAKMAALEAKLTQAREITYRLADDKYRESLRVMSILEFRAENLVVFLNATEARFHAEIVKVDKFDFMSSECASMLNASRSIQRKVESTLLPALTTFQHLLTHLQFDIIDLTSVLRQDATITEETESRFLLHLSSLNQSTLVEGETVNLTFENEYMNETFNTSLTFELPELQVLSTITNYRFGRYAYYVMLRSRMRTVMTSCDAILQRLEAEVNATVHSFPTNVVIDITGSL